MIDSTDDKLDFTPVANFGGDEIQIPVLVINKTPGDALISQLTSSRKNVRESLVMAFSNPIRKEANVDIQIVVSANDPKIYRFLSNFNNEADSFGDKLNTNITFYYSECLGCSVETIKKDCMRGNANYCKITCNLAI